MVGVRAASCRNHLSFDGGPPRLHSAFTPVHPPSYARRSMLAYLQTPAPRHELEFLAAVVRSRRLHSSWVTAPSSSAEYRLYLKERLGPRHIKNFVCNE